MIPSLLPIKLQVANSVMIKEYYFDINTISTFIIKNHKILPKENGLIILSAFFIELNTQNANQKEQPYLLLNVKLYKSSISMLKSNIKSIIELNNFAYFKLYIQDGKY